MPAPRLLDKKLVNASLATERKQQIDQGIKIAKTVDALRNTRVKEEQELEEFRTVSIARVKAEIDTEIAERDSLRAGNARLREERIQAQAPLDLKEEWSRVRENQAANEVWQDKLTQQSIEVLAREEDVRTFSEKLEKEKEKVFEEHELSRRALLEADAKFAQAEDALERAEKQSQEILQSAHEAENRVRVREEDATLREVELSKREEAVALHETDLSNRETKLKSRQEIFIRAQNYIKSKK